ncbi:MAG: polymer-forming cytoskeletal protein [Zoogloeaceae bacterium]|jgi:cytoskeletal protein CcmA (bactofilin family)|nr:polymer-forming cytoskeletal protein [Zoogloeaceae bacterium]
MFAKKTNTGASAQIDSLIGHGTKVEGNISFSGGLRVDGEIHGKVIAQTPQATLMLSEQGAIHGHVDVAHLIVNGAINGPVRATEFLELHPKARIIGDVEYGMIEIQQGALIEGHLILRREHAKGEERNDKQQEPFIIDGE